MLLSWLIFALALSLDAYGIGIAYGMRAIRVTAMAQVVLCLLSFVLTGAALLFGQTIGSFLPVSFSARLGPCLLLGLGLYQILTAWGSQTNTPADFAHPARLLSSPEEGDRDRSSSIDGREAFALGIALSIDAACAVTGAGIAGHGSLLLPAATALFQLLLLRLGTFCGKRLRHYLPFDAAFWGLSSGLLLVLLGIALLLA